MDEWPLTWCINGSSWNILTVSTAGNGGWTESSDARMSYSIGVLATCKWLSNTGIWCVAKDSNFVIDEQIELYN